MQLILSVMISASICIIQVALLLQLLPPHSPAWVVHFKGFWWHKDCDLYCRINIHCPYTVMQLWNRITVVSEFVTKTFPIIYRINRTTAFIMHLSLWHLSGYLMKRKHLFSVTYSHMEWFSGKCSLPEAFWWIWAFQSGHEECEWESKLGIWHVQVHDSIHWNLVFYPVCIFLHILE